VAWISSTSPSTDSRRRTSVVLSITVWTTATNSPFSNNGRAVISQYLVAPDGSTTRSSAAYTSRSGSRSWTSNVSWADSGASNTFWASVRSDRPSA